MNRITCCLLSICWLAAVITGCHKKNREDDHQVAASPEIEAKIEAALAETPEERAAWLNKANEILRPGRSLDSARITMDSKGSRRDLALELMKDPSFGDMVLDFSTYWLGVRPNFIRQSGYATEMINGTIVSKRVTVLNRDAVVLWPALNSARAVLSGGSFFDNLFAEKGPTYNLQVPYPYFSTPSDSGIPPIENISQYSVEGRSKYRSEIRSRLVTALEKLKPHALFEKKTEFCEEMTKSARFNYSTGARSLSGFSIEGSKFELLTAWCMGAEIFKDDVGFQTAFAGTLTDFDDEIRYVDLVESKSKGPEPLAVDSITVLQPAIDRKTLTAIDSEQWGFELFYKLQNSSTNRNRKRGSWVLKRFFCDDLTPVNVEIPKSHSSDRHASEASCYSCHYKLDPMAGYFREIGLFGANFSKLPTIQFDDFASQPREDFERPWRDTSSSGREWNIGFIRSTTDDSQNTYGSNFSDLMTLLKTSPEVKDCFVKRVFEYVIGEEQAVDKSWIREVSQRFELLSKTEPSQAFKAVVADVLTSKAFGTFERNNNTCYDTPTGVDSKFRAPCRVATLIDRNCVSCHSASSSQGGLDLSTWKKHEDGQSGFKHVKDGKEVPTRKSFEAILDRLTTSNEINRMPLMKSMPDGERDEFAKWVETYLTKIMK